jgi:vacuolar-type H+-ATPase subunit H
LEELIEHGHRWPFGNGVVVDREAFLNLIDQMRISIPQEIRRSQEFEIERERYIAQAQEDARVIVEQAREDAARMLDDQEIKRQAEVDAKRIVERARREAQEVRDGADIYAEEVLRELDRHARLITRTIQNGLRELGKQGEGEEATADETVAAPPKPPEGADGAATETRTDVHSVPSESSLLTSPNEAPPNGDHASD